MKNKHERKWLKRQHRCTRCQGWRHHKNTCKKSINPPANEASTQESENVDTSANISNKSSSASASKVISQIVLNCLRKA